MMVVMMMMMMRHDDDDDDDDDDDSDDGYIYICRIRNHHPYSEQKGTYLDDDSSNNAVADDTVMIPMISHQRAMKHKWRASGREA